MKILLAPSETKREGGVNSPINILRLHQFQKEVLYHYEQHLKNSSIQKLSSWFKIKKLSEVEKYKSSTLEAPTLKAIQRYTGVAFDAIDYNNLSDESKYFIDTHTMIFSNLFGMVRANFAIPDYKFKQGAILPTINNIKHYKNNLKNVLDKTLGDEILDLSASHYSKFYKPSADVITFKFLKDGKVVSHWAKYYRGDVLRQIAINNIDSFDKLLSFKFDGLELKETTQKKNIKMLIMNITKEAK